MIRLVAKTFPITSAGHDLTIKQLNARKFKTFVISAQEFRSAKGGDIFDKLVALLATVIVNFKDEYTDEDNEPLTTVEDILWALDMSVLNEMCTDVIQAVKLGEPELKNLNSSPAQHTAESVGNVETAVEQVKEPALDTQEKTEQ